MICVFICMLMLVSAVFPLSAASYQQKTQNNGSEEQKGVISPDFRRGFFIGYFDTITWEEERCILYFDGRDLPGPFPVTYFLPFTLFGPLHRLHQLGGNQQIQLIDPKYCLIQDNFIIGFSKMLFPSSKVSLHIISQSDEFNQVRWIVDGIEGDNVWGGNLDADLFNPDGSRFTTGHTSMGPYPWKGEYLSIGAELYVKASVDGIYQMRLFDTITGRVLYSSPYIRF
jgi:hypothetical protein